MWKTKAVVQSMSDFRQNIRHQKSLQISEVAALFINFNEPVLR